MMLQFIFSFLDHGRCSSLFEGQATSKLLSSTPNSNEAAKNAVKKILNGPQFHPPQPPRPFAGILNFFSRYIHKYLSPIIHWISNSIYGPLNRSLNGYMYPSILVVVAFFVIIIAAIIIHRRPSTGKKLFKASDAELPDVDPETLDALAEKAHFNQDYKLSIRLRFKAGLTRLEKQGLIINQQSQTLLQLSGEIPSNTFSALANDLTLIVYGNEPATESLSNFSKLNWPNVLVEVNARKAS